jgi:uncharacterized protein with GYD domain
MGGDIIIRKGAAKDEVTYFYLIKQKTKVIEPQEVKARRAITKLVKHHGGQCRLYMSSGGAFDFVSVVTGITTSAAIKIAAEINKRGVMKATLLPGTEIFESH